MGNKDYDKVKHLEFIQTTINRMAVNSFIIKGWSVTLISGIIVLSLTKSAINYIYLALLPALIFWGLDAYYLWQEKLFRELYNFVRKNKASKIDSFSMSTKPFIKKTDNWFHILFSVNILTLHLTLIIIIVFISIFLGGK